MRHRHHFKASLPLVRPGFSFVEILFAVMILGVGFIMVAAIFPASLTQTKATAEETNAASIARSAVNYIQQVANNATMEGTNNVVVASTFDANNDGSLYTALRDSMIPPSDTRFAWMVFYRRAGVFNQPENPLANYAQITMVPITARNTTNYAVAPVSIANPDGTAKTVAIIIDGGNGPDKIQLGNDGGSAAPGAYVIIADCPNAQLNGHVFRLGTQVDSSTYQLAPGNDYSPQQEGTPGYVGGVKVFVVGRGTDGVGLAQDVAAYTTYVQVR